MASNVEPAGKISEKFNTDNEAGSKEPHFDEARSDHTNDVEDIDGDYGSYNNHIFSDPKVAEYWAHVYEKAQYEGRHRFDPTITWSAAEEKRLKRKVGDIVVLHMPMATNGDRQIDWRIMTWCWLMFVALDLNRKNINRGGYSFLSWSRKLGSVEE